MRLVYETCFILASFDSFLHHFQVYFMSHLLLHLLDREIVIIKSIDIFIWGSHFFIWLLIELEYFTEYSVLIDNPTRLVPYAIYEQER